ncbi:hypothetical protein V6N11_009213 [Hibiscus sabdariffa]|uniref:Thioredoxin domain-containing protein n=1 Tax=Hibiscus sabdariffa TaxID=183260 RepID=A0ABR2PPY5_9ROSI
MASFRLFLAISLVSLFLFATLTPSIAKTKNDDTDDDEDLCFLEETEGKSDAGSHHSHFNEEYENDQYDDLDDDDFGKFSDFIKNNKFVMVEFYTWCGHFQSLALEYTVAATELKGEEVALAKVDATEGNELAQEYDVQGFPTVYFFVDGEHKPYPGARNKEAIMFWIKKKTGPGIYNITTIKDDERILTSESKVDLGYMNSLVV